MTDTIGTAHGGRHVLRHMREALREARDFIARTALEIKEQTRILAQCDAALASDDGWVKVDESHPLPSDLKLGDEMKEIATTRINGTSELGFEVERFEWRIVAYRRRPSAEQGG
jgi:hypothetical protein